MNKIEEIKEFVWRILETLRTAMYYRESEYGVVRLVFIKYAVDNYIGATSVEDMQMCSRAQKMFSMRDVENGIDTIIPVLQYIDKAYGLKDVICSPESVDSYSAELFGYGGRAQKKNTTTENYKDVIRLLCSVDLEENDDSLSKGQLLVMALTDVIVNSSYRNRYAAEHTTKPQLSKLVSMLLNVQADDRYCDFTCGVGLSTLGIVRDKSTAIKNADINPSAVSVAAMLLIMSGYKSLDLRCEDTLNNSIPDFKGNKVFVDAPFGMRLEKKSENEYNDSSLASIDKAMSYYLDESGDAMLIVNVPSGVLFKQGQALMLKKKLIDDRMLRAVIALPPLNNGTIVSSNLLVITREENDEVMFINASECQPQVVRKGDISGNIALPEERIEQIVHAFYDNEEEKGFSKCISMEEIAKQEYNLVPTVYIPPIVEEDNTSIEEINKQLDELYKQLLGQ